MILKLVDAHAHEAPPTGPPGACSQAFGNSLRKMSLARPVHDEHCCSVSVLPWASKSWTEDYWSPSLLPSLSHLHHTHTSRCYNVPELSHHTPVLLLLHVKLSDSCSDTKKTSGKQVPPGHALWHSLTRHTRGHYKVPTHCMWSYASSQSRTWIWLL